MKKTLIAIPLSLICALLFAQPAPPPPEEVIVKSGMGTGNDYQQMNVGQKWVYAMGAVNGMMNAPMFYAPENGTKWFDDFTKGMTNVQVAAIISKFLKDNPERWHEPLSLLTYVALRQAYDKTRSSRERLGEQSQAQDFVVKEKNTHDGIAVTVYDDKGVELFHALNHDQKLSEDNDTAQRLALYITSQSSGEGKPIASGGFVIKSNRYNKGIYTAFVHRLRPDEMHPITSSSASPTATP